MLISSRMGLFGWLAYGVGTSIGRSLLDERERSDASVRTGTEEDFRKDEARFKEEEKRLNDAEKQSVRR